MVDLVCEGWVRPEDKYAATVAVLVRILVGITQTVFIAGYYNNDRKVSWRSQQCEHYLFLQSCQ